MPPAEEPFPVILEPYSLQAVAQQPWPCLKEKSNLLWVSISLLGLTLIGRLFEITSSGVGATTMQPIIIETVLFAMLLGALKLSKKEA